jgi:hypothetical protein
MFFLPLSPPAGQPTAGTIPEDSPPRDYCLERPTTLSIERTTGCLPVKVEWGGGRPILVGWRVGLLVQQDQGQAVPVSLRACATHAVQYGTSSALKLAAVYSTEMYFLSPEQYIYTPKFPYTHALQMFFNNIISKKAQKGSKRQEKLIKHYRRTYITNTTGIGPKEK